VRRHPSDEPIDAGAHRLDDLQPTGDAHGLEQGLAHPTHRDDQIDVGEVVVVVAADVVGAGHLHGGARRRGVEGRGDVLEER